MTRTNKKHTAISKLILTAAATGIGISAIPYAQADDNKVMTVRKLTIEKSENDAENDHKNVIYDWDTFASQPIVVGYRGGNTLITDIAPGEIYSGSTDAVTGDQLYTYVPNKIEKKLEEFIQNLQYKVESGSDVKIGYSDTDKQLTLTLSEDLKNKINNISNSGGKGEKGENGKSAYEIWKEQNPTLADTSETAFLKSLKGEQGAAGAQGEKGANGENGKSAYEIWKEQNPTLADTSETAFLKSLKGEQGAAGAQGEKGANGENGKSAYEIWKEQNSTLADTSETAFLKSLKGEQGAAGEKGEKGEKGANGENGKSAYEIWKEQNPTLADTSETAFLKSLKGEKGEAGAQGDKGEKGEKGENGANGETGKSAYEIWKSLDTAKRADKTEQDFIDSLKGEADTTFTRTEESDGTMLTAKGKITNERPNGEVRISGLAAGRISPSSSDAVNGAQLFEVNERISSIEQKVDKLDKSMNGGIAKAGAVALLPQPTYAGHSMVSASTAHYNGEQALAIGYSSLSDNGKVILKAGASFNFSGNNTKKPLFGAAVGYQW